MYQKQISQLIGEISSLAVEVTLAKKAIVLLNMSGHVAGLEVQIYDSNAIFSLENYPKELFKKRLYFSKEWSTTTAADEREALEGLHEIKLQLQSYLNINPFHQIWENYQPIIEKEILEDIALGRKFDEEQLFHDVMLETTGHEISLECVYQSLKLSNGEGYAKLFKTEMLSNIEWLGNMVNANWSEYEKELDAV